MARIGLWGGSYNPPTIAHKSMARFTENALALDKTLWIVTPHNPLKDITTLAHFSHRFKMVQNDLKDSPKMEATDIEEKRGSSYTSDTVKHLREQYPDDHLFLFMGADNWENFHKWGENRAEIFNHVSIVILPRPGYDDLDSCKSSIEFAGRRVQTPDDLAPSGSWMVLDEAPVMDVAATAVRELIGKGEQPKDISDETWRYIKKNGLYAIK